MVRLQAPDLKEPKNVHNFGPSPRPLLAPPSVATLDAWNTRVQPMLKDLIPVADRIQLRTEFSGAGTAEEAVAATVALHNMCSTGRRIEVVITAGELRRTLQELLDYTGIMKTDVKLQEFDRLFDFDQFRMQRCGLQDVVNDLHLEIPPSISLDMFLIGGFENAVFDVEQLKLIKGGKKKSLTLRTMLTVTNKVSIRDILNCCAVPLGHAKDWIRTAEIFRGDSCKLAGNSMHAAAIGRACADCEELVPLNDTVSAGGARCIWRRCKKCHSARKALRTWYSKANRLEDWETMSTEDRRKLIIQNKNKGAGKGHRRRIVVAEEVTCKDSLKLQSDKPFMTRKQFIAHLKSKYDWADEDFQTEWEAAKSNPAAVWAKDEYGEWTVSLLRVATASSARELTSSKGVREQQNVETEDVEATLSSSLIYLPASTANEWSENIQQSLVACASNTNLAEYRNLVKNRWHQLLAFASNQKSPSKLSPSSRQIKSDVFQKEGPLKEASIKGFKKKLNGYVQGLSNACDRLNAVQREEEGNSEEEPEAGAVADKPKDAAPVLASMEHLPEDQLNLLRQISAAFAEVRSGTPEGEDVTFYFGCVNEGLPSDPSKHTTAAYFASSIPLPELGALPRDEIVEELQSDKAKDVKQRRDLESAHGSVVSRFAVW
eukprot:s2951_g2.t1